MELNKVMLIGNLTRDPVYRTTGSGLAVTSATIAVSRRMPPNRETGERQEETAFVDLTIWDKQADFARNYLHKGSRVFVEGRLRQENWQDKESGQNRSKLTVVVERIQFAESRAEAEARMGHGGGEDGGNRPSGPREGAREYGNRREAAPARNDYDQGPGYGQDAPQGGGTEDDLPF